MKENIVYLEARLKSGDHSDPKTQELINQEKEKLEKLQKHLESLYA